MSIACSMLTEDQVQPFVVGCQIQSFDIDDERACQRLSISVACSKTHVDVSPRRKARRGPPILAALFLLGISSVDDHSRNEEPFGYCWAVK